MITADLYEVKFVIYSKLSREVRKEVNGALQDANQEWNSVLGGLVANRLSEVPDFRADLRLAEKHFKVG